MFSCADNPTYNDFLCIHPSIIIICSTFIHPLIMISIKIHPCVGFPPPSSFRLLVVMQIVRNTPVSLRAIYICFHVRLPQIAHDLTANGFRRRFVIICVHQTDKGVVVVVLVSTTTTYMHLNSVCQIPMVFPPSKPIIARFLLASASLRIRFLAQKISYSWVGHFCVIHKICHLRI